MLSTVAKYWPTIGAGFFVVYAALWAPSEVPGAITAFVATLGVNAKVTSTQAQLVKAK